MWEELGTAVQSIVNSAEIENLAFMFWLEDQSALRRIGLKVEGLCCLMTPCVSKDIQCHV